MDDVRVSGPVVRVRCSSVPCREVKYKYTHEIKACKASLGGSQRS